MPIVRIEPNKPLTVSLKYASAKEKQGQYGVQFLYTLENGDALFLPPIAHAEIQALHPGPGEPFTLTKSIGQGNQAVWKVERIFAQPDGPPTPRFDRPAASTESSETHNKNYIAPKSTTNGRVAVMPATAPTPSTPQSRALANQLIAALGAVKLARDYARQQGLEFDPTSRDICALAITGGIQSFKEGVY